MSLIVVSHVASILSDCCTRYQWCPIPVLAMTCFIRSGLKFILVEVFCHSMLYNHNS